MTLSAEGGNFASTLSNTLSNREDLFRAFSAQQLYRFAFWSAAQAVTFRAFGAFRAQEQKQPQSDAPSMLIT
jgi:hypothetical protein